MVGHRVGVLAAVVGHDRDDAAPALVLGDAHHARDVRERGLALGRPGLEQLDDAGQTAGDVGPGDAAGVERPHRQLRAGLADRLGGDDAHGLAELDGATRGQRTAVAGGADAEVGLAGEHRPDAHPIDLGVVAQGVELVLADGGADRQGGAGQLGVRVVLRQLDVVDQHPAEDPGLEVRPLAGLVGDDVLDPQAADGLALAVAVDLTDDELLRDVDETPGQVARVGRAQRGVDEALPGARRGDEVLEHRQALAEVGLDGPRDHVAAGVGHQAAHARDLADLHHVPAGTRADHHVDGVEVLLLETLLHRRPHLVGGVGPDLHLLLPALAVGDDAPAELALDLLGFLLVAVEDRLLLGRRLDVLDRDGEARAGRVAEAQVLEVVEAGLDHRLGVVAGQVVDDVAHVLLLDRLVDEAEAERQRPVEDEAPDRALAVDRLGRRRRRPGRAARPRSPRGSRAWTAAGWTLACRSTSPAS